jgi:hypothetical protein
MKFDDIVKDILSEGKDKMYRIYFVLGADDDAYGFTSHGKNEDDAWKNLHAYLMKNTSFGKNTKFWNVQIDEDPTVKKPFEMFQS